MRMFECPTCRNTMQVEQDKDAPFRPFCSERCKLIDLNRWFNGEYRISEPARPQELEDRDSENS